MSAQFGRNIAIVIGIDNYGHGISTLKTAANDARQVSHILKTQHNYQIWGLLNEKATLEACLRLLEEFLPTKIRDDDRVIFYFAGHGIALNGDHGPEGFLIPQDAKLGDTSSYLPMARLQTALSNLSCHHFLGILDCCFAGAFRWSSTRNLSATPEVIHREHYDRFIESPAWQVITSAAHDQEALDNLSLQGDRGQSQDNHSPFAHALMSALSGKADLHPPAANGKPAGKGVTTATELYLYLREHVEVATEKNGKKQTPGIYPLQKHDRGEYIFLTPGHELNLPEAPPLDESQNPYRGLESFKEEHSELFFGRQKLTQKLARFCQRHPLTVVLGASGTGKSSLVRAGLIPWLHQLDQTAASWKILAPMRPGEYPFKGLNQILSDDPSSGSSILNLSGKDQIQILTGKLARIFRSDRSCKLLLVVDQAEELITLSHDRTMSNEFLALLARWLEQYPDHLRVVLTLRSDFEPQLRNLALKSCWGRGRFIVPAMTREELKSAIAKPASKRVIYFEPSTLIDRLIDEVAQMPGALPLLSFALSELYLKYLQKYRAGVRDKRAITQSDYEEIGGVAQSLTRRANCEYEQLVKQDPAYAQTICNVMLRMVAVDGGDVTRRQVHKSELKYPEPENARVEQVIQSFSAARLLVEGKDSELKPYVEPAHDALVRGWQKLLTWKRQQGENLLLQRRLTAAATEWKELQQQEKQLLPNESSQYLWHNNPYLNVLKQKRTNSKNWFNRTEAEFVERSLQRKLNNTLWLRGVMAMVIGGFSVLIYTIMQLPAKEQFKVFQELLRPIFFAEAQTDKIIPGTITSQALSNDWKILLQENGDVYTMFRQYNRGKVLALGHQTFLTQGEDEQKLFLITILNLLHGIGQEPEILISTGHCEHVTQEGGWDNSQKVTPQIATSWEYKVQEINDLINDQRLIPGNILIIGNAWGNFKQEEIDAIQNFVSRGGYLMLLGTGWSWQEYSSTLRKRYRKLTDCHMEGQDTNDISTYPMNTILENFSAKFTEDQIMIN